MKMFILIVFLAVPFLINPHKDKTCHVKIERIEKKELYKGIDVSKYQGKVNWDKVDTIDFVICKKSEGITLEDQMFYYNIKNIKCLKGVYHFFRPQFDGIEQGEFFLKDLDTIKTDIIPTIDVEYSKWWDLNNKNIGIKRLIDMIEYVEKRCGYKPIIYTSPKFWNDYICDGVDTMNIKLWVADWRGTENPEVPCKFTKWEIWQVTSTGKVKGIDGYVDVNISKNIDSLLIN